MHAAIIYCTSCLSVEALEKKKLFQPQESTGGHWDVAGNGEKLGGWGGVLVCLAQGKNYKGCQVLNVASVCQGPGRKI